MKKAELKNVIENISVGEEYIIRGNMKQDTRFPYEFGITCVDFFGTEIIIYGDMGAAVTKTFNLQFDDINTIVEEIVKDILDNDVIFANCTLEEI